MALVNKWFDGEDEGVNDFAYGTESDSEVTAPVLIYLGPLPTRVADGESFVVTAIVADSIGNPVAGEDVALSLQGVTVDTPDIETTNAEGTATFTVTPTTSGVLTIIAATGALTWGEEPLEYGDLLLWGGLVSAPGIVAVGIDPIIGVIGRVRQAKRDAKSKANRYAIDHKPSYLDIGPISPKESSQPGFSPVHGEEEGRNEGMDQLAQHLMQIVQQQEQALQVDIQRLRSFLGS